MNVNWGRIFGFSGIILLVATLFACFFGALRGMAFSPYIYILVSCLGLIHFYHTFYSGTISEEISNLKIDTDEVVTSSAVITMLGLVTATITYLIFGSILIAVNSMVIVMLLMLVNLWYSRYR